MQENYEQFNGKSLYDLKDKGVINFSNGFGGWGNGIMETSHNKLFFVKTDRISNSLNVVVKTEANNELSHSIRSENQELLTEIAGRLQYWIEKSISEIYGNKSFFNKKS